jgi:hypothetical protein
MESQALWDANEKKNYGSYDKFDPMPLSCWVQEKKCSSKEEWERLVKPFLEE